MQPLFQFDSNWIYHLVRKHLPHNFSQLNFYWQHPRQLAGRKYRYAGANINFSYSLEGSKEKVRFKIMTNQFADKKFWTFFYIFFAELN